MPSAYGGKGIIYTPNQDPIGIVVAGPVQAVATTLVTIGASNRNNYQRVVQGSGLISKIGLHVGTSSGNISVAVYRSSGVGVAAVPGTRVATSGAVACPAGSAYGEVALGGSVYVTVGDWISLSADNTSATFAGLATEGSAIQAGFVGYEATAHPAPSPAGTITVGGRNFLLLGIA